MLGILAILLVTIYMAFLFPIFKKKKQEDRITGHTAVQVKKLWGIAQASMRERKPLRAEKALLAILKVDEKNAAAYNRLGILYAKGQKFEEAIECFEIAQSLDNNASSLHNVGLIYYEIGEYEKSAMAFKQALEIENDLPSRYIALAKAEEKMGNRKAAIEALESAFKLDHSISTLRQILAIHTAAEDTEAINETNARIEAQAVENAKKKQLERRRMMRRAVQKPRMTKAAQQARRQAKQLAATKRRKIQ
ncbi:tetratricopeptide repeat protein [Candidatus Saccharibacteria bacterium]|nr:tetratricopeptide repeat protein [Candidatus Saccharibacteria bacterium]